MRKETIIGHFMVTLLFSWVLLINDAGASPVLVSSDTFGNNALVFDSDQSLLWLSPTATEGLSYLEITQLLVSDPRFVDFRFATVDELGNLFTNSGIPDINDYGVGINGTVDNVPGSSALQSLFGITHSIEIGVQLNETAGFLGTPFLSAVNGFMVVNMGQLIIRSNVATPEGPVTFAYAATNQSAAIVGTAYGGVGGWLVSSVPEPAIWAEMIMGFTLLMISFVVRRDRIAYR